MAEPININPLANLPTELPAVTPKAVENPKINFVANDVKAKYSEDFFNLNYNSSRVNPFSEFNDNRIKLNNFNIDVQDAYTQLNSGDYISRFENFIPNINNEERLALQQSTGEKWLNGITKFVGKTGTAVIGGTIGTVEGLISGISEGSLSAAYNSDLNKWLDDLNTKMDYSLPNLYTDQEKNAGFLSSLGSANFWANDVLGGLSFTAGTIISEGIWAYATGGTSLLSAAGRWSTKALTAPKALKALNTWKSIAKEPLVAAAKLSDNAVVGLTESAKSAAIGASNTKRFIDQSRFLLTSAGYESAVEARHYMKETEESWLREFEKTNGRLPNASERQNFENSLKNSANAVFTANLALVGSSNLATIGKVALGKTVRPNISNSWFNKNVLGVGFEQTAKGTFKTVDATKAQKLFGKVYGVGKYGVIEGVFEEGGQSVISSTAENYMINGYKAENLNENYGIIESFYDAMSSTYGTKQGFKEVGIGFIVGLLGGGANTGFRFNEVSQERQAVQSAVDTRNAFTSDMVVERLKANSKIIDAQARNEKAKENNDLVGEMMTDREAIVSSITRDYKFQGIDQGKQDFSLAIEKIPVSELSQELGITEEEAKEWKTEKITEYFELADKHAKNLDYAGALLGQTRIAGLTPDIQRDLQDAFAYTFTMGENAEMISQNLSAKVKQIISQEFVGTGVTDAITVEDILDRVSTEKQEAYNLASKKAEAAQEKINRLEKGLLNAQYTRTESEQTANRANQLTVELAEAQEELLRLQSEKQLALDAFNLETIAPGTIITTDMLDNQMSNIQKLKNTLNDIKSIDPQRHAVITKLITEQNKAVRYLKSYSETTRKITDPNTRIETVNGWVGSLIKGRKELNEGVNNFFAKSLSNYRESIAEIEGIDTQIAKAEVNYNRLKKGLPIPQEYIQELQDRVKSGTPNFSFEEQAIYDANREVAEENDVDAPKPPVEEAITTGISTIEKLEQKIRDIIKGNAYLTRYDGTDIEELSKKAPSKEDIDRYNELLSRTEEGTPEEQEEVQALAEKLNQWKILDGSTLQANDSSITDLLNIIDKLKTQQTKEQTKTDLDKSDYIRIGTAEDIMESSDANSTTTIITPDKVLVKKVEGIYQFSFINATSFPRLFPNSILTYLDKNGVEKNVNTIGQKQLETILKKEGTIFKLQLPSGDGLTIRVGVHSQLEVNAEQFDNISADSNLKIMNLGSESYIPVYERLEDGTYIPLQSDFTFNTVEEQLPLNTNLINSLPNGTIFYTTVNLNDTYNQQVISQFRAQGEKYAKGKITEEQYQQALEDLENNINIYVMYENELVGSLRALTDKSAITQSAERNKALRKKAVELIRVNENKTVVDLGQTLTLRLSLLGSPNFTVQENEDGNLSPQNRNFTSESLENIIGTGYAIDGQEFSQFSDSINTTFLKPIVKRNKGQKIPFVIVRQGSRNIAFPITLIKTTVDKSGQMSFINSPQLSKDEKANLLLDLLLENNLTPQSYNIDFSTDWVNNSVNELTRIAEDLSAIEDFLNVDRLAGTYNKQNLISDAQISVDLADNPFAANKIVVNISEVRPFDGLQNLQEQFENVEEQRIRLESELSQETIDLYRQINTNPAFQEMNNSFLEVFDEANIFTNPQSHLEKVSNTNTLVKAFSRPISKKLTTAIGAQNVADIKEMIQNLENLKGKQKAVKVEIKSAQLKKQVETLCS